MGTLVCFRIVTSILIHCPITDGIRFIVIIYYMFCGSGGSRIYICSRTEGQDRWMGSWGGEATTPPVRVWGIERCKIPSGHCRGFLAFLVFSVIYFIHKIF